MADVVRMPIDMDIGIDTIAVVGVSVMSVGPYKTKPAGWIVQVGGCVEDRLCSGLAAERAHHADGHARLHGHRHRHRDGAARQH
jgi:hypothetical protein